MTMRTSTVSKTRGVNRLMPTPRATAMRMGTGMAMRMA